MFKAANPDTGMIELEEAQQIVLGAVEPTEVEEVEAWRAVGRPLARDVATDTDLSPFANSAMDGYALLAADLEGASDAAPVTLDVVGHEAAGHVFEGTVGKGQAVRIMTGAPVPEGADAVVKYEVVEVEGGDGSGNEGCRAVFRAPARPGDNIREAGLEAKRGEAVMRAGEAVTAAGAGLLASAGCLMAPVHRAPRVSVLSIGSELVAPDREPARGQIRDSNSSAIMASALAAGAAPEFHGIVPDDPEAISEAVHKALRQADFVVTSGGASAGDYDFLRHLVSTEGELLFDRISLKPGKAITFGIVDGVPVLALSGNPAAAFVGFEMLARPAIRKMLGHTELTRPVQLARIGVKVKKRQARRFYNRARVGRDEKTGELVVEQAPTQNSALLGDLHRGNALLMVPDGLEGYEAGDLVPCVRYDIEEGTVL